MGNHAAKKELNWKCRTDQRQTKFV